MKQYHKINTIFKRDKDGKILIGEYSTPEIEILKDIDWVFTEKVDGTNIRIMWDGENVSIGGKTDNAQIPVNLYNKLNEIFKTDEKTSMFVEKFGVKTEEDNIEVCLYGEGYGARIQKGGGNYIKNDVDFVLFDVKIGHMWLNRESVEDIANFFGIRIVPIIGHGTLNDAIEIVRKGFISTWGDFTAEGIVARPSVELSDRRGNRIITKIKHVDFYGI